MQKKWSYTKRAYNAMMGGYTNPLHSTRLAMGLVAPGSKVLSAGCGPGREVRFLLDLDCDVTAVDISKEYVEQSKKIAPEAKYHVANLADFETDEKFDYIVCLFNTINALQGFTQRKKFIDRCHHHLNPGGWLILSFKDAAHTFMYKVKFWKGYAYYCILPGEIKRWFHGKKWKVFKNKVDVINLVAAQKLS